MATICKLIRGTFSKKPKNIRYLNNVASKKHTYNLPIKITCIIGGTVAFYTYYRMNFYQSVQAYQVKNVSKIFTHLLNYFTYIIYN